MVSSYREAVKKRRKRRSYFLTILLLIDIFFLFLDIRIIRERQKIRQRISLFEKETQHLEKERQDLLGRISGANKNEEIEKIAREELNLVKNGEKVVAFPFVEAENKEIKEDGQAVAGEGSGNRSFWQKLRSKNWQEIWQRPWQRISKFLKSF